MSTAAKKDCGVTEYFREIFYGAVSLLKGMRVTIKRLVSPVVTVQYPRDAIVMHPMYRGHIELIPRGEYGCVCVACGTCEKACPSNVIKVMGLKEKAKGGEKRPSHFLIDYSRCSLCGLCVESCPESAIRFSLEYQLATMSRWENVIDLMARVKETG